MERKRQFMTDEVWDTILNKYVVPYKHVNSYLNNPTLIPHKDGEPLLNKNLSSLLSRAAKLVPDMGISIYSHGLLLKRSFIEFLGSLPNPTRLLVSFHFFNYDGTENDYTSTTEVLKDCVHNYKPDNLEVIFVSHLVPPMTSDRLNKWKDSWDKEVSTGKLTVHANVAINPWTGLIENATVHHGGCPYNDFHSMFFGATGNVIACCMDLEEEIVFGNVMKDDPEKMVGTVRAFYAAQKRREVNHKVCYDCFGIPKQQVDLIQLSGVKA